MESGWSEDSRIYTSSDFEKYNPDKLIGRKGFAIYKTMMQDEQIKAVVKFKRDAVTSRDFFFELDADQFGITPEEAERRINLSNMYIDKMLGSWMDALNGVMSGIYNGYSITEKLFGQFDYEGLTWWGIQQLKLKPYDTFYFKVDEFGNEVEWIQKMAGKEQNLDPNKFIKYIVNPDTDEHYGGSELREAYRAWWSKDVIIKLRNMWLERHAGGFRYVQAKEGQSITANSAEYNALVAMLSNINTSSGMILPSKVEMKGDYPANNVAFKEAIDDYNTDIARALLVPNLLGITPSGQTGSYSQSTTQLEAFLWTLEADARRLEEVLNEQLFRQLGEVNFGDDAWPKFRFKPASGEKKMSIIGTWKDLVSTGAVRATDTDETHLREMLEFPEAGEEIKKPEPVSVLPTNEVTGGAPDPDEEEDPENKDPLEEDEEMGKKKKDETVAGRGLVSVSAFTKALRRVDFAVIAKTTDSITDEYSHKTADVMDMIVEDLIEKGKEGGLLDENIKDNIKQVKVDRQLKRKLNNVQTAMLKEGFAVGTKHAQFETDKAMKSDFSRRFNRDRFDAIADDYFKTAAFKIAGDLSDEAVRIVEQEILNGAKYSKTWAEVEKSIYSTMATKGMISIEEAKAQLGEALGVANPDARIRTISRTTTFDAVNQARHAYFTDPELEGFVQAYEYSAILDDRTTSICRHLDEEDRGNHSIDWYADNPQYMPPNHFNCRSLLIPVTEVDADSFEEGGDPTMQPQEGFR